jgi:hypothetical protein
MSKVERLSVAAWLSVTLFGCSRSSEPPPASPIRIVHATIVDLPAADRKRQEDALSALLHWVGGRSDIGALVIASNFDAAAGGGATAAGTPTLPENPNSTPTPPDPAAEAAKAKTAEGAKGSKPVIDDATVGRYASLFEKDPVVVPVYLVPAARNLDANQDAASTVSNWRATVDAIREKLDAKPGTTKLSDLTGCYDIGTAATGRCSAEVQGSKVRLVGYPASVADAPTNWVRQFETAMDAQSEGSFTILVAPLAMPVDKSLSGDWMKTAAKAQVALGVNAPTARREAFTTASVWRAPNLSGQWWVTPQLVSADAASGSAAGVSVISVTPRGTASRDMFWYTPPATFTGTIANNTPTTNGYWWVPDPVRRLWRLGDARLPELSRAAVLLIALLAAFLTSVAVWQIPPANVTVVSVNRDGTTPAGEPATPAQATAKPSLLDQNFARTVISGLGGLAVATLMLDSFDVPETKSISQQYYIVWFIVGFFVMLPLSSAIKSAAEGFRVVSLIRHPQPAGWRFWEKKQDGRTPKARWPVSWFLLTSIDAFFNLIQGRNELKSTLWAREIETGQLDALIAIDRICEHLRAGIVDYANRDIDTLPRPSPPPPPLPAPSPPAAAASTTGPVLPAAPDPASAATVVPPVPPVSPPTVTPAPGPDVPAPAAPAPDAPVPDDRAADVPTAGVPDPDVQRRVAQPPAAPVSHAAPPASDASAAPSSTPAVGLPAVGGPAASDTSKPGTAGQGPTTTPPRDDCDDQQKRGPRRVELSSVRVAVSVLSEDRKRVFYVSWPPESSSKAFDSKSMAYVSVAAGVTRWWREGYENNTGIVLLKNDRKELPEVEGALKLSDFFQNRASDYRSFIVFPIPLRPRDEGPRAGLHISFRDADGVHAIWCKAGRQIGVSDIEDVYKEATNLLDATPDDLKRLFQQSINVIESLLRHFNEKVFVNALQSRRR